MYCLHSEVYHGQSPSRQVYQQPPPTRMEAEGEDGYGGLGVGRKGRNIHNHCTHMSTLTVSMVKQELQVIVIPWRRGLYGIYHVRPEDGARGTRVINRIQA